MREPASSVVEAVDGTGSVGCFYISPGVAVDVSVFAIQNAKQGLPTSITVATGKLTFTYILFFSFISREESNLSFKLWNQI